MKLQDENATIQSLEVYHQPVEIANTVVPHWVTSKLNNRDLTNPTVLLGGHVQRGNNDLMKKANSLFGMHDNFATCTGCSKMTRGLQHNAPCQQPVVGLGLWTGSRQQPGCLRLPDHGRELKKTRLRYDMNRLTMHRAPLI